MTSSVCVTCRGIPLLGLMVNSGGGDSDLVTPSSAIAGASSSAAVVPPRHYHYVSIHQLSVQLWQRFDTPRVSVQKKVEDLKIPLLKCNRSQLDVLRQSGVVDGFRATIVKLQDAERLCDALQRSREKRGLSKHPLKPGKEGGGGERKRRRREEGWLLKMKARMSTASKKKGRRPAPTAAVDERALIGTQLTPPTPSSKIIVTPPASNTLCSLKPGQLPAARKQASHEPPEILVTREERRSRRRHFRYHSPVLDALDLCTPNEKNMATLRSHNAVMIRSSIARQQQQQQQQLSNNSGELHPSTVRGRVKIRPLLPPPLKRPHLHPNTDNKQRITSPTLSGTSSPPLSGVVRDSREQSCQSDRTSVSVVGGASTGATPSSKKTGGRFLFWCSDDDEEVEDCGNVASTAITVKRRHDNVPATAETTARLCK